MNRYLIFYSIALMLAFNQIAQAKSDSCSYLYNNNYQLGKIKTNWDSTAWKTNGFSKSESVNWAKCGFGPKGAAIWKMNGGTPLESALLREARLSHKKINNFNKLLAKHCGGKFYDSLPNNPYKAKNRCFLVGGNVQQILSKNVSLIKSGNLYFVAYFGKNKFSPGEGVDFFGFGAGATPFKYKSVDGVYRIVPVIDFVLENKNPHVMTTSQSNKNFNYMFGH